MKMSSLLAALIIHLIVVSCGFSAAFPANKFINERIVNGQDAANKSHPHQVTLQWYFQFFDLWFHICGGSVIDDRFVLTAAHCVENTPVEEFRVIINEHRLNDVDGNEQVIGIKRIYIQEDWINGQDIDYKIYPNDIAVLELATEVLDKKTIVPMATSGDEDFAGVQCTISGWGLNDTSGWIPNTLQEVNMTVMSQAECADFWRQLWPDETIALFQGQICIFSGENATSGASACSGDSGGPMICNGLLAGVTSWGVQGCRDQVTREFRPSVYARVSYYFPWIDTVLGRYHIGRG